MFESLSERLGGVFDRLTKAGARTEADVVAALREVRVALLEAGAGKGHRLGGHEVDHAGADGRQVRA